MLLLDEPTLGLDIAARRALWDYVRQIRDAGSTIVLTTRYLDEADRLCDRVTIVLYRWQAGPLLRITVMLTASGLTCLMIAAATLRRGLR